MTDSSPDREYPVVWQVDKAARHACVQVYETLGVDAVVICYTTSKGANATVNVGMIGNPLLCHAIIDHVAESLEPELDEDEGPTDD